MPGEIHLPRRNQLIDVLRGISIMMVLVSHYPLFWPDAGRQHFGRDVDEIRRGMGYYGVAIFFVISGFLITSNTLKRYTILPRINAAEFWWMRFARIYPMLLACLVAMAVLHWFRVPAFVFQNKTSFHQAFAAALSFRYYELFNWSNGGGAWNPLWSLSVEEMFYLAFPFVCLVCNGVLAGLWICLFTIATAFYLRLTGTTPFSTTGAMDLLALGCFVALCRPYSWHEKLSRRSCALLGMGVGTIGLLLIIGVVSARYPLDNNADWGPLCCGLGAACVLVGTQLLSVPRLLRYTLFPVSTLGIVSYELYLVHMPILDLGGHFGWTLGWAAGLSVTLAFVLHAFYAEPLNRDLRALVSRRSSQAGSPPTGRKRYGIVLRAAVVVGSIVLIGWVAAPKPNPTSITKVRVGHLANLPPGSAEPVAEAGHAGQGDLVYMVHIDGGKVRFGVDHWGGHLTLGDPVAIRDLEGRIIQIQLNDESVKVVLGSTVLIESDQGCFSTRVGVIGRNDAGFITAPPLAVSDFAQAP